MILIVAPTFRQAAVVADGFGLKCKQWRHADRHETIARCALEPIVLLVDDWVDMPDAARLYRALRVRGAQFWSGTDIMLLPQ